MRQTVKSSPLTTRPRTARTKGNLQIRVVTDLEEFRSLREIWNSLLTGSSDNNAYLTWEWLFTWRQHCGRGKKLCILVIKDGKRIVGIIPLMRAGYGPEALQPGRAPGFAANVVGSTNHRHQDEFSGIGHDSREEDRSDYELDQQLVGAELGLAVNKALKGGEG